MRKILRFIFIITLILLLVSWIIPAAYGQTNSDTEQVGIHIEAAPPEATPSATFYGRAIGSVTAGDLFYIDAMDSPSDMSLELYITNSDELIHYFRYLILKIAVYIEDAEGQWKPVTSQAGTVLPDTYITMRNSPVPFNLPGLARYKVTIESGYYYCLPLHSHSSDISPQFYLNVDSI